MAPVRAPVFMSSAVFVTKAFSKYLFLLLTNTSTLEKLSCIKHIAGRLFKQVSEEQTKQIKGKGKQYRPGLLSASLKSKTSFFVTEALFFIPVLLPTKMVSTML